MSKFLFKNVKYIKKDCTLSKACDILIVDKFISTIDNHISEDLADKVFSADGFIMGAGLINLHAHNAMSVFKNIESDKALADWLEEDVLPREKKLLLNENDVYAADVYGILEMLRNGITTFLNAYMSPLTTAKAVVDTGIRSGISLGYHHVLEKADDDRLEDEISKIKEMDSSELIDIVLYLHSVYNSTESQFNSLNNLRERYGYLMHTHVSETLKEVGDTDLHHQKTPVKMLEDFGFFDGRSLVAHSIHIDKEDVNIYKKYDVNVVSCPSSNGKLASGVCPYDLLLDNGINITLGTDGSFSNNSLDILKEMLVAAFLSKTNMKDSSSLNSSLLYNFATVNAGKALNKKIGVIEEGGLADIVLYDASDLAFVSEENFVEQLVYTSGSRNVYMTMVNGEVLYENGKFTLKNKDLNINEILKKCKKINRDLI